MVVGMNQLAWRRIVKASASSTGTSRRPSAATPSHWYVPTYPGDDGIATPRAKRRRHEDGLERCELDSDRATGEDRCDGRSVQAPVLKPIHTATRRRPTGSASISTVSRISRRMRLRLRRSRVRRDVYSRAPIRTPPITTIAIAALTARRTSHSVVATAWRSTTRKSASVATSHAPVESDAAQRPPAWHRRLASQPARTQELADPHRKNVVASEPAENHPVEPAE